MMANCWAALLLGGLLLGKDVPADTAPDEAALKKAGVGTDGPALLEFFRKRTYTPADEERVARLVEQLGHRSFAVREKAGSGLTSLGPPALSALRRAQGSADPEVKRRAADCISQIEKDLDPALHGAAARLLVARSPDGAGAALLDYLSWAPDETAEEEALSALLALSGKKGAVVVATGDLAGPPARRAAAALLWGRSGTDGQRAAVRKLLADPEPKVRLRAAQGLLAGRDRSAVPVLVELLSCPSLPVGLDAEDALGRLAGKQAPAGRLTEEASTRKKQAAAWQAWWKAEGDRLDLARADVEPLPSNSAPRAEANVRRFLDALCAGDGDAALRESDVPFLFPRAENSRATDAQSLEKVLKELATRVKDGKYTCTLRTSVDGEAFLTREKPEVTGPIKKGLEGESWRRLRVVYATASAGGRDRGEELVLVVRVRAGRPRVIALMPGPPR